MKRETAAFSEQWLRVLAWFGAVSLLALGLILADRNEAAFRRQTEAQMSAQAGILAASLTAALSFDDTAATNQYVRALRANPRIAAAAVYDARGRRIASFVAAGSPAPPARIQDARLGWSDSRASVMRPSVEQGQVLGYVYLRSRADTLADLLSRQAGVALLTVMGLLLLVLVSAAASTLQRRADELAQANARLTEEIEARSRAEEALRQSQKMEALGQLTGGIAHDFNNLLQVIVAALELIGQKPQDAARVQRLSRNALDAAGRGASLTRQLLAFSRTQKLDLTPLAVADLVGSMQEMLVRTLGPQIELVLELDAAAAPVLSDRTQLELAVLNLAINARDAMPEGGRLTISARHAEAASDDPTLQPGAYLALTVADTGAGMAPDVAARAFDPFYTTKEVGKGTGLGLSQVYGVARQAGGAAVIESRPGQGTRVTMFLRQSAAPAAGVAASAPPRPVSILAPPSGATILVVDDEDGVRDLVREALQMLGYVVHDAPDGRTALELTATMRPHLMIVDFAMPQMNGAQLAHAVRQRWPDLPILFASGHADTDAIRAATADDAVILRKPFEIGRLADAVSEALRGTPPARDPPDLPA